MGADFRALFEHADGNVVTCFGGELLQPDRRGKAGGTGADDHDVIFHGFALNLFHRLDSPKYNPNRLQNRCSLFA